MQEVYYQNIRFAKEFIFLNFLQKKFPNAYHEVVTTNIKEIRCEIKDMIYDDIDYYLWEGTHEAHEAIDEFVDVSLEQLQEIYKFKLSRKLKQDLNDMLERELFRIDRVKKESDNLVHEQDEDLIEEPPKNHEVDKQKYEGYKLALERLKPHWNKYWDEDTAHQYIRTKVNNDTVEASLINRIENCNYYQEFLNNQQSVDLLLSYLNEYDDESSIEYTFYEKIFVANSLNEVHLDNLQKVAYALYVNDMFIFRKETLENLKWFKEVENPKTVDIDLYSTILEQQDMWFRFLNRRFHIFLLVRYIISFPERERVDIYKSFEKEDVYYENHEVLWKFCYEVDRAVFCANFILPIIQMEVDAISKDKEDDMIVSFFKKHDLSYEYNFWKEEQHFELWSGSGGDALLEDIASTFEEWNIPSPFRLIEDCFNFSHIKNAALRKYIGKYCPIVDGKYEINVSKELLNKEFLKLLKPAGVTKIIVDYMSTLKNLLSSYEINGGAV